MGLKDIYNSLEDKWYGVIDKIDSKIPVYGIIDRIDSIVPSFALFLIIILAIIIFVGINMASFFETSNTIITIKTANNELVPDTIINYKLIQNGQEKFENKRTNLEGELILENTGKGTQIYFDINLTKGTNTDLIIVPENNYKTELILKQKIILKPLKRTILIKDNFVTLQRPIDIEFFCENPTAIPKPSFTTIPNGNIEVEEPTNCIKLYAKINDEEYKNKQYTINALTYQLILEKKEIPTIKLTINTKEEDFPVNGFNIRLAGDNTYTKLNSNASEEFNIIPGEYLLSISDPGKNYGSVSKTIIVNENKTEEVQMSKTIKAIIGVTIKDDITNELIDQAIVSLKNKDGKELERQNSLEGKAEFLLTTTGSFIVSAKKVGGIENGYFAKEIELEDLDHDTNIVLELEKITTENAGLTKIIVKDQDKETISNAKIYLKYEKTNSLVELNQTNNYVLTDINGEATFLAGKISGKVYAYAIKYPFKGQSSSKTIDLEGETIFEIEMEIGNAQIKINAENEKGEKINGEAKIYNTKNEEISGLLQVENGISQTSIKAGRTIFIVIKGENTLPYYTQPMFLMPNQTIEINPILKTEINQSSIVPDGELKIYNEQNQVVRTMKSGNKYYALLKLELDEEKETLIHFRAGKEELLENDYIEIDDVEVASEFRETRGTSYSPERGYEFDSENLTDSLAKWTTIKFDSLTSGTHLIKINFRLKKNTPSNKELQFFWRAKFNETKLPPSNASEELYDQTYASNIYFEGEEAICEETFCVLNEWVYDKEEELYTDDFIIEPSKTYTYHYQLINNSNTDYGINKKRIALGLEMFSEKGKGAKIISYKIKGAGDELTGNGLTKINDYEIKNFEKNTAINIELELQGNLIGDSSLRTYLKSEGRLIFTKESVFTVPNQKELFIGLDKTFIPSLLDTEIILDVMDEEPINEAYVNVYAKEPGFDEYLMMETITNRLGKAKINSGAHFPNTKILIEVGKIGYATKRLELSVSEEVVKFNPSNVSINLNTVSKRETQEKIEIGNATGKKLEIYSIKTNANFQGAINQEALQSHFNGLRGKEIDGEGITNLDLIRIRLDNGLTQETMLEPINLDGEIIVTLKAKNTNLVFDVVLPFTLNIGSGAQTENGCLILNLNKTKGVTEKGKIMFQFDLLNACKDEQTGTLLTIENITAQSNNEIEGIAEVSLQSYTTSNGGRTALDSLERKLFSSLKPNEKLSGTLTFTPNTEAIGKTINVPLTIKGKFQGQTVTSVPTQANFEIDVINLKECISIDSESSPVRFNEETTMSVDATACLGQKIDIWLCKGDSGCSGGAEGKISLSKTNFELQNNSETITVRSSDLPGSYGITVNARIKGKSSWYYIGEVPVAFREPEGKFFELSKYEVNIVGDNAQDSLLLTNKMLDHTVKVKATDCVWGAQEPEIKWLQVIGGASIGASLGSMIGGAFDTPENQKGGNNKGDDDSEYNNKDELTDHKNLTPQQLTDAKSYKKSYKNQIYSGLTTKIYGQAENGNTTRIQLKDGTMATFKGVEGGISMKTSNGKYHFTNTEFNADKVATTLAYDRAQWSFMDKTQNFVSRTWTNIWSNPTKTKLTPSTTDLLPGAKITFPTTSTTSQNTLGVKIDVYKDLTKLPSGSPMPIPNPTSTVNGVNQYTSESEKPEKISFSSFNLDKDIIMPILEETTKISFIAITGKGVGSVIGAALGAWAAYEQQEWDCSDNSQIANYRDYVIFLQGEEISVTTPTGEITETRSVPSDAGELGFSLGGVGTSWDFSNADYSSEEHVGIKLKNNGINNPKPSYGTLTINATVHNHGSAPISLEQDSSEAEFDVICKKPTFGKYWIGLKEEEGLCSGSIEKNYSQKYHIRVISGEPQEEDAKIKKSKTCYNGILTGATGKDALPRVKYNWNWNEMTQDMCDYKNPNYVYCDGVQFLATIVKKLAALDEFFDYNPSTTCPEDPILTNAMNEFEELNSLTELVAEGRFGIEDVSIFVESDGQTTATVTVNNKTDEALETYVSGVWKGEGEPISDLIQTTFDVGKTDITFEATLPEWDDVYFFQAVANGPSGNRRAITRTFRYYNGDEECWAEKTTRSIGGVPSITYYLVNEDQMQWTDKIQNPSDLYETINFGTYLMRENYTDDLFQDFSKYYLETFGEVIDDREMDILEKIASGEFSVLKRFTNQTSIEAGLYDVYFNIDFENEFNIKESIIETSLLSIRSPYQDNPLYKLPFDGHVGEQRLNYGTTFSNETKAMLKITDDLTTESNVSSNGMIDVKTHKINNFEIINSSIGTRGQLAIITHNGATADMTFTPNYATPVIAKYTLNGTNGLFTMDIEKSYSSMVIGGNLSYWTGAAKSKDFFGGNASEVYNKTPDSLIDESYGFRWEDATRNGNLYLKSIFYTPVDDYYVLTTENGSLWTPNNNTFSRQIDLLGISGMNYNQDGDYFNSLENLFEMVENQDVCISNDGSTISFWWNPKIIENTKGTNNSLMEKELSIIGN